MEAELGVQISPDMPPEKMRAGQRQEHGSARYSVPRSSD